mmetsp:Transcript_28615/g.37491  ORF Transcript_28615/g.37491 Transcript_28615/m.37491 type:complete len:189 (+) Transcript_28615:853-1419(+)
MLDPEMLRKKDVGQVFALEHEALDIFATTFDSELAISQKALKTAIGDLPYISKSTTPYQYRERPQFVCSKLTEFCNNSQGDVIPCKYSSECVQLVAQNKMRQHIGEHVLAVKQMIPPDTCDFCGKSGTCTTTMKETRSGKNMAPQSNCTYAVRFELKRASVFSANSRTANKCSNNVPVQCSLCADKPS